MISSRIILWHFAFTVAFVFPLSELQAGESLGPSSRRTGLVISEIMYHPLENSGTETLEFVEIYNSKLWYEDISGYRISGDADFTFPNGTVLEPEAFLVVAIKPENVRSMYNIENLSGPARGSLSNGTGTVRLVHRNGGVLLEVNYRDTPPWPVSADGLGHSMVLNNPSVGESFPDAWAASETVGGSPGKPEPIRRNEEAFVLINELLAHASIGSPQFIELHNPGSDAADVSEFILGINSKPIEYAIPQGTVIPPRGYLVFDSDQTGFSLDPAGETLYLRNKEQTRVLDAIRFEGQPQKTSFGRCPDGTSTFRFLASRTPGMPNGRDLDSEVVINEIMYNPISTDANDEYVELYNKSDRAIDLSLWQFTSGIKFEFPPNSKIPAKGYLIVAKNPTQMIGNHSHLNASNTYGGYNGLLSNRGERIALARPEPVIPQNSNGAPSSGSIFIQVDEVTYGTGGRWGKWSDGGGSSLELIDTDSDNRIAYNWADSDESQKSEWTPIDVTGVLDLGVSSANSVQVLLMGEGECLVDNVEMIGIEGTNQVRNVTFDDGLDHWFPQGSHVQSGLDLNDGIGGTACLHLRSTHRGDTGANRIRGRLYRSLRPRSTGTLRAQARWLCGFPELLIRLRGNYLEAPANLIIPKNLGTPGAANSRAIPNTAPAIWSVQHRPTTPSANEAVVVTARLHDPDGIASATLKYRVDPSNEFTSVPLLDDGTRGDENAGDGLFSATIPGHAARVLIAFHISADDNFVPSAHSQFPMDAPDRECLVRFGDPLPPGKFGTYRFWITRATFDKWRRRLKLSNEPLDATFVYNDERVIYNVGALYSGSPFHSPGYSNPTGALSNYSLRFPPDDRLLGVTDVKLTAPGNTPGDDGTALREQTAYWIAAQMGLPYNYQRSIYLYVNGARRGRIFEDTQIANSDVIREWFPKDDDGELYKIAGWFEFNDDAATFQFNWATLQKFRTAGGVKKLARYRWNWQRRGADLSTSDYSKLFELVDNVNAPGRTYQASVESQIDVKQWMRTFAAEHIVGNWDSFGNNNGQNMFAYKPERGPWQLLIWDLDIVLGLGGFSDSASSSLFKATDPTMARLNSFPPFRRAYWRAIRDAYNGPLDSANADPLIDAKFEAFRANGVTAASPRSVKSYLATRRRFIERGLSSVAASFAVTSNQGTDFMTDQTDITLTGSAPVEVDTIHVNGIEHPTTWNTVINWSIAVPLQNGINTLVLEGRDEKGVTLPPHTSTINVTVQNTPPMPNVPVVINEWMAANTAALIDSLDGKTDDWFELYNPTPEPVNLQGYSLSDNPDDKTQFIIPAGFQIAPNEFLLVWADNDIDQNGLTADLHVNFQLNKVGDTIALFTPDGSLVDSVTFAAQTTDRSEGRWPDGQNTSFFALGVPSPGALNTSKNPSIPDMELTGIESDLDGTRITWKSEPGGRYHVQYKNSVEDAAWFNLSGDVFSEGATAEAIDTTALENSHRFYRVQRVR